MKPPLYALEAGRVILRDGHRFVTINRVQENKETGAFMFPPEDADTLARWVVEELNRDRHRQTIKRAIEAAICRFQALEDAEENTLGDDKAHRQLVKASRLTEGWPL